MYSVPSRGRPPMTSPLIPLNNANHTISHDESNAPTRTTGSEECDDAINGVRHMLLDMSKTEKALYQNHNMMNRSNDLSWEQRPDDDLTGSITLYHMVEVSVSRYNNHMYDTYELYHNLYENLWKEYKRVYRVVAMRIRNYHEVVKGPDWRHQEYNAKRLHAWHTFSDNLEVLMNILEENENESKDSEDEEEEATS